MSRDPSSIAYKQHMKYSMNNCMLLSLLRFITFLTVLTILTSEMSRYLFKKTKAAFSHPTL